MEKILKITNNKIKLFLILFCSTVFFFFEPNYGNDSLRYVFAGKQLLANFFDNISEPLVGPELLEQAKFHSSIEYTFPKREFFTIIPNLIFYSFSIWFEDSLNYIVIFNLIIFSLIFYFCLKFYKFNRNIKKFLIVGFLFFGHYQIAGWNIKILPEVMYFSLLILLLIKLINYNDNKFNYKLILILLSIGCFLIRPQGLIFITIVLFFYIFKKFFFFRISFIFLILLLFNIFFIPLLLFLDLNNFYNIPVISVKNTGFLDGAVISGWINYLNGDLIYQNIRFEDKRFNFEQNYGYLDIVKIILYRIFYYLNPYRYYQTFYINIWNFIYFSYMYLMAIMYFVKSDNILKKNLILLALVAVLSFHMLFPVTGTFRYQLSFIAILFIINFEYILENYKNYERQNNKKYKET